MIWMASRFPLPCQTDVQIIKHNTVQANNARTNETVNPPLFWSSQSTYFSSLQILFTSWHYHLQSAGIFKLNRQWIYMIRWVKWTYNLQIILNKESHFISDQNSTTCCCPQLSQEVSGIMFAHNILQFICRLQCSFTQVLQIKSPNCQDKL